MSSYRTLLLYLSLGWNIFDSVSRDINAMNHIKCNLQLQYNLNDSNTDGLFTVDDSNSFLSPYKILPIAQENKYLRIFFLFYHGIVCRVYTLESPHRGDSNEYTQHTIVV